MIDIFWLLFCSVLVFLMQPGFMCLESGLTRSKNSINVAIKNLADFGLSVGLFWAFGYALMFGRSRFGWFGATEFFLDIDSAPKLVPFFIFQAMFCGTATTIFSGAVAERMKFVGYLLVALLVSGLIYPIFGHWVWNGMNGETMTGWLGQLGFVDFAGSTVVHSIGAWVSLAALLVIGARTGRFPAGSPSRKIHGSNLPFSVLGAMLLWFGWLGFNVGSLLTLTEQVPSIMMHTILAGVGGMATAGLLGWLKRRLLEVELLIYGSLAGLVSINAACNVVNTPEAFIIGAIGGAVMTLVLYWLERWHIDDAVGAVAVHGGGGVWGALAVALFGQPELLDTGLGKGSQLLVQLLGVGVCFVWAFGSSWILLRIVNRFFPLRVSLEEEEIGLNVAEHGAKTETYDLFQVMDAQASTQDLSLRVPVEPFTEVGHIATRYNQVMAALEAKNQQILEYLEQVDRVTAAAIAFEQNTFTPSALDGVAERDDELGTLARVFQHMAQTVKAREQELAEAKDQLAAVLDAVPGSISWVSADGLYLGVNRHLSESLNLSADAIIGREVGFFNDSPEYVKFMRAVLGSSENYASRPIRVETRARTRYYLMAAQKYQQGNDTVAVGIDITERRQAQEALRIAEENYRSIFENALEGIFQANPDGQYTSVNPAMARIYGYNSPAEMVASINKSDQQIYVDPDCREDFNQRMAQAKAIKGFQYQVYRKDGSQIWVEENTRAVQAADGKVLYYEGIIQDITQRKQEEADLRRQVQELRVEIDQQKRERQVTEITQTDYFRQLQAEMEEMRLDEDDF